jgi:copper chaperone
LTARAGGPISLQNDFSEETAMPVTETASEPVRFQVEDMSCGHCEKTIREALSSSLPGAPVDVDLPGHLVTVKGPAETAEAAIRDAGYTPVRR